MFSVANGKWNDTSYDDGTCGGFGLSNSIIFWLPVHSNEGSFLWVLFIIENFSKVQD